MGYAVYWNETYQRHQGYGVPAICDYPKCNEKIDRGMAYVCGEPMAEQFGCGLFFCGEHRPYVRHPRHENRLYDNCTRCRHNRRTYSPKPETAEWMRHVLLDKTWKAWRAENPTLVLQYRKALSHA